jgi:HK97 family phage portal protein
VAILSISSWFRRTIKLDGTGNTALMSDSARRRITKGETALQISAVWACVKLISTAMASLPWEVYTVDGDGEKTPARDQAIYKLLNRSPNADMSAFDFRQALIANRLLWGNAFCYVTYRGKPIDRKIVSLELLRPDWMTLRLNADGSKTYIYHDPLRGRVEYEEDYIFHSKGMSLDGCIGMSVVAYGGYSLGDTQAMEESAGRMYARGMSKTGVLTVDKVLTKEQREDFKKNIASQFSNLQNGASTSSLVLEGGMKFDALALTPEDAQLLESRSFGIEEICRWFGVNPVLIGHTEKTTTWGSGIEQINLQFVTYTLQPIAKSLECEVQRSLIPVAKQDTQHTEMNMDGFLRADAAGRAALYASGAQNGYMKRSEIRRKENLPYAGVDTDTLTAQSNLVSLDKLGTVANAPQNNRSTDAGQAPVGAALPTAQ